MSSLQVSAEGDLNTDYAPAPTVPTATVLIPGKEYRLQKKPPKQNFIATLPDRKLSISQQFSVLPDIQMDQKSA